MDELHRAYILFTEEYWLVSFVTSCVIAGVLLLSRIPITVAIAVAILVFGITVGWMVLDLLARPGSHNLLPLEMMFKIVILIPLIASIAIKFVMEHF
jgi:hypothetical protein